MPTPLNRALIYIHSAVLLFALSGLFGKWLTISAYTIVFGRTLIAALCLYGWLRFSKQSISLFNRKQHGFFALSGGLLALHWLSFFAAIQYSSVTIGLLTFASFPVFVALLEPMVTSEKLTLTALVQSLLTVIGIYLVVPLHQVDSADLQGALLGLFSAFSFAILTLLNRRFSNLHNGTTLAFFQNSYAAIAVLPIVVLFPVSLSTVDIGLLLLLGVVFTALAHSLFILSLKTIKAQTASIVVSLEPIYGILAASIFLLEPITLTIISGATLIIGVNVWALRGAKSAH